jgi:hypothetical protein
LPPFKKWENYREMLAKSPFEKGGFKKPPSGKNFMANL